MRSTNLSPRDQPKPGETTDSERQSVVTPLFAEPMAPRRTPVVHFGSVSRFKRGLAILGSVAVVGVGGWLLQQSRTQQRATERLALGCLDVSDCRAVLQNVEALQDACWFNCSHLVTLAQQARTQFRLVLEQHAQQEQVTQDKAYQSAIQNRKTAEEEHSKLAQATRLAERDHEHRLELERIAAQTERLRALRSSAEGAQLLYFKQLTPEQRLNRLHACHKRGATCEELVQQLAQAAPALAEQRALISAHEEYITADPKENAQIKPSAPASESISEPLVAERL